MNVNEYGVAFVFSTGYNMSAFTSISITFTKPDLTILTVTNLSASPVTVPNTPLTTADGTFPANEYAQYYFVNGDVNQVGEWSARVTYNNTSAVPPQHLISDIGVFTINP